MQLTGIRVALWVCGVATSQGAVEVTGADGAQIVGELVVDAPTFYQSTNASVRPAWLSTLVLAPISSSRAGLRASRGTGSPSARRSGCANPAIAVPLGLAVSQAYSVDHAVAADQ